MVGRVFLSFKTRGRTPLAGKEVVICIANGRGEKKGEFRGVWIFLVERRNSGGKEKDSLREKGWPRPHRGRGIGYDESEGAVFAGGGRFFGAVILRPKERGSPAVDGKKWLRRFRLGEKVV